ncbi:MAG: right-handed parallel beta-helix repeat-containing protein [Rickettsiales bacterium]
MHYRNYFSGFISSFFIFLLLISPSAHAATYYVSVNAGNDSNAGTEGAPFKTIARGSEAMASGDTLYIRAGTYLERMVNSGIYRFKFVNGKPGAYTRYAAYPGEEKKVIIKPTLEGYIDYTVWFGEGRSFIEISGLVFDSSTLTAANEWRNIIGFDDAARNNRLINNEIRFAQKGILNGGGNEFIGNHFHHLRGYGIYTKHDNGLLEGNIFHDIGGYAIHHYQQHATVNGWIIRNNVIYRAGRTFVSTNDGRTDKLAAVVISRSEPGKPPNQFYNNIIYDSHAGIQVGLGTINPLIANNTVYGNDDYGIKVGDSDSSSKNARIINNISFGNGGAQISDTGTGTVLQNNLTTDPKFVNPAAGDFGLQAGSPAINKGMELRAEVLDDFMGTKRPVDLLYDIGAFEGAGSKANVLPGMAGGLPGGGIPGGGSGGGLGTCYK